MRTSPSHSLLTFAALVFAPMACGQPDLVTEGGDGGGTFAATADALGETDTDVADTDGGDETGGPADSAGHGGMEIPCGDGWLDADEACDDGNEVDHDGCDADCMVTEGVATFSAGGAHTCAVSYSGAVRCFGDNARGQLGYGSVDAIGDDETPLSFGADVEIGHDVVQISAGEAHTCARTAPGAVYCWGGNELGQLGYGHTRDLGDDDGETPQQAGPVPLGGAASWVSAGRAHTCALMQSGEIKCWGDGRLGQLGQGDGFSGTIGAGTDPYTLPLFAPALHVGDAVQTRALAEGTGDHACVADHTGLAMCWGSGLFGQLGMASDEDVGIAMTPAAAGSVLIDNPVVQLAVGRRHTCARTLDGRVQCWGDGADGQLGYGDGATYGDDEVPFDAFVHLGGDVMQVTAGAEFTCALLSDRSVRCWGSSGAGQLGYGTTDTIGDDELPTEWNGFGPVLMGIEATAIDAGSAHVCARGVDSQLRCWGRGVHGRLGYGDEHTRGDSLDEPPMLAVPVFRSAPVTADSGSALEHAGRGTPHP